MYTVLLLTFSTITYIQVHDVEYAPSIDLIINETLPAVHKLKEKGLCRYIGITGYPLDIMRNIITRSSVKIDSILSYCHLSLNDNSLTEHFEFLTLIEFLLSTQALLVSVF